MSPKLDTSKLQPKLAVVGGGTGGHLFPGIAVAEAWLRRYPNGQVVFVGSERGIESRVVPALGYELVVVPTERLKNAGAVERARSLLRMPRSLWRARRVVASLRPDVVLGVGGFVSGPVVLAAALSGYFLAVMQRWERVLCVLSAICLIAPGLKITLLGMVIALPVVLHQMRMRQQVLPT